MIRIVTDSSSDIPPNLLEAHSIEVVPLTIRFESQEFVDGLDLTTADFWHRLVAAEALPETAAPSTGLFGERYQTIADSGADGIVVITISSELSGTYQSAVIAAEQFDSPLPIKVIDSASVGMGLGLPVLAAAERAAAGASLEEVAATATRAAASTTVIAALDTLEYLKRGGRIGSAQAFFGSLLNIKPIVTLENGVVTPFGRVRTRSKALAALEDRVAALGPRIRSVAVFHGAAPDATRFSSSLQEHLTSEVITTLLGAVVGTHTGPGTIGIAYSTD